MQKGLRSPVLDHGYAEAKPKSSRSDQERDDQQKGNVLSIPIIYPTVHYT